ncbi:MAG: P-II family nitrogen regulator [Candidatus Margulisiibacteriota bacterium]|nr:MAG: transcriptional regulator [Candidatus Margulisbacteria bacterium GWD2_39_127]OGI03221.1 MAG: transcriptional regulator [Candidatus Margulisbacteria bacterium GWF2_38_17]OGI11245.1 MAG: transcriptional regulator [Candidatus Margulisbacteria bacterium GWE2_39_32]PZM78538.1 MAG: P-II family nitrogen regulator [Candidatus Margulisiibacteriota bacterium]HAR63896.1 transcriptional regulator [Candidatus Margulisiibacteriota bacterium]
MKKIEAIVKPSKLEAIKEALVLAEIPCMTISAVKGAGLQRGFTEVYRGTERKLNLLNKVKIECVVSDDNLEKAIDIIVNNAHTGEIGDGKIFVYDVADAIRIRTKERGPQAIR